MQIYTKRPMCRKKIRYVGTIGFKKRLRWRRAFVVAVHKVESCGVCA